MREIEFAVMEVKNGGAMMLESISLAGSLKGLMFEASLEQRFINTTDTNAEVVYTFPIPYGSVLMSVEVQLGEKRLSGSVVSKSDAEETYEEAISDGNSAIMLEKNIDKSFTLNLGNLAARESCIIVIKYSQVLQFEQQGLRVLIPTVIAPSFRYSESIGGLQLHHLIAYSTTVDYRFDITLRLHGELAKARVASPSHSIGVAQSLEAGAGVMDVSLAKTSSLDRDFVLIIDQLPQTSMAVLAQDILNNTHTAALVSFCPRIESDSVKQIAVKILVDCSGSMAGDSIQSAKRALQSIVLQLTTGDRFSLSRFGNDVEHRSRGLWSVKEATLIAAQRWIGNLEADMGGTEMQSALESTFTLSQNISSDVLLVTDGEISEIDSTINAAKKSNQRVFVVGIGSSPAEAHLRRLAEATGGACDFVAPGENVMPAILRMFARLRSPRLIDAKLIWPENLHPIWVSDLPQSIFDGDTLNVFAIVNGIPHGSIQVMATADNKADQTFELCHCSLDVAVENAPILSRVVASARMESFSRIDQIDSRSLANKLAIDYQLISDDTNYILVHQRENDTKMTEMPSLHKVVQMLPAGWGGVSTTTSNVPRLSKTLFSKGRAPSFNIDDHSSTTISFSRRAAPVDDHVVNYSIMDVGDSPVSFAQWLRSVQPDVWPKSYKDLTEIDLNQWVIDWVEIVVHKEVAQNLSEQTFIEIFLRAFMNQILAISLNEEALQDYLNNQSSEELKDVEGRINLMLKNMFLGRSVSKWPDSIFKLDTDLTN